MTDFPELDDLPDDPEVAFVKLYEKYSKEYLEQTSGNEDPRSAAVDFMTTMIGISQGLDLDIFDGFAVPDDWDYIYPAFTNFERMAKQYAWEIRVRKSRVTKVYSVQLNDDEKGRVRHLISEIRKILTEADLDDRKRNSLFAKLSAFEADVDRIRTRFDNAMLAVIDIIGVVDKGTKTLGPINEMLRRIQAILGNAKDKEPEQNQLPAPSEKKKLPPPTRRIEGPKNEKFPREMDDDIPF